MLTAIKPTTTVFNFLPPSCAFGKRLPEEFKKFDSTAVFFLIGGNCPRDSSKIRKSVGKKTADQKYKGFRGVFTNRSIANQRFKL